MSAVNSRENTLVASQCASSFAGSTTPENVVMWLKKMHARARRDRVVEKIEHLRRVFDGPGQRDFLDDDAVALGFEIPGMLAAGMFLIGHEDFVAGFHVKAVGDVAIGFSGVAQQRDLVASAADEFGEGVANSFHAAYPQMG